MRSESPLSAPADFYALLACMAPAPIPYSLFVRGRSQLPSSLKSAAKNSVTLANFIRGLTTDVSLRVDRKSFTPDIDSYGAPPLAVGREEAPYYVAITLALITQRFPSAPEDPRSWRAAEKILPHALTALDNAARLNVRPDLALDLSARVAAYYLSKGSITQAFNMLIVMVEDAGIDHFKGPVPPSLTTGMASIYAVLGDTLFELGRFEEAAVHLGHAKALLEQVAMLDDVLYVRVHRSLAVSKSSMGDFSGAEAHIAIALKASDALGSVGDAEGAKTRRALGHILCEADRPRDALPHLEAALQQCRAIYGGNHIETAIARSVLAICRQDLEDAPGARDQLELALETAVATVGPDHPETAVLLSNLGSVLASTGQLDQAQRHVERALLLGRRHFGRLHPSVALRYSKLGGILRRSGDLVGARSSLSHAVAIGEDVLSSTHPDVFRDLTSLGYVLHALSMETDKSFETIGVDQRLPSATSAFKTVLRELISRAFDMSAEESAQIAFLSLSAGELDLAGEALAGVERQGSEHLGQSSIRRLASAWRLLAYNLSGAQRRDEAHAALSQAERLVARLDESERASLLPSLAAVHRALDDYEGAISLLRESATLGVKLGQHRATAVALSSQGRLFASLGRIREAASAYDECLQALSRVAVPDVIEGVTWHDIGDLWREQGNVDKARESYSRAVALKRGRSAPEDIAVSLTALAHMCLLRDDFPSAFEAASQAEALVRDIEGSERLLESILLLRAQAAVSIGDAVASIPHLEAAYSKLASERPEDAFSALPVGSDLVRAYHDVGRETASVRLRERLLQSLPRTFDQLRSREDPQLLVALSDVCIELAAYADSRTALLQASSVIAPDKVRSLGLAWHRLGRAQEYAGDLSGAWQAYSLASGALRDDEGSLGVVLHDMGDVRRAQGQGEDALRMYRRAVERKRRASSERDLCVTLLALGRLLVQMRRFEEAYEVLEERLTILERLSDRDKRAELITLQDLGNLRRAEGRYSDARAYYERALLLQRDSGEVASLALLAALAQTQLAVGDLTAAGSIAAQVKRNTLDGLYSPDGPDDLLVTSTVLSEVGDAESARQLCEWALAFEERRAPRRPAFLGACMIALSSNLRRLGRVSEARLYGERALGLDEEAFGPSHPAVARDLVVLSGILAHLHQYDVAIEYCSRALGIDEAEFGRAHTEVIADLIELASVLRQAERLEEACDRMVEALTLLVAAASQEEVEARSLLTAGRLPAEYQNLVQALRRVEDWGREDMVNRALREAVTVIVDDPSGHAVG